ncbi:hypothetical protein CERZMDRAFT_83375 [Cercospora zeae-maydis SCOH1-5]|uniref:Uncharacterized protein n=1 Tax=Cercospora zeae-maydis SCOH1-5 TaxID=717836 RepID=A0A6A6FL59_9PEZI|nr:hypothetical protein CERZMDRAFT_83375 [Cercospora zeae-maydis SCOH1-5]
MPLRPVQQKCSNDECDEGDFAALLIYTASERSGQSAGIKLRFPWSDVVAEPSVYYCCGLTPADSWLQAHGVTAASTSTAIANTALTSSTPFFEHERHDDEQLDHIVITMKLRREWAVPHCAACSERALQRNRIPPCLQHSATTRPPRHAAHALANDRQSASDEGGLQHTTDGGFSQSGGRGMTQYDHSTALHGG